MEKAIHLNNQGVYLIERRLYCDAIRTCTKALEQAKQTLCQEDIDEENDSEDLEQESNNLLDDQQDDNSSIREQSKTQRLKRRNIISVLSLILTSSSSKHTAESENSEESVEADECYIYRKPIRILSCSTQHKDDSVFLLFNLALALHLEAIERKSKAALEWALKLYEIGYKLQIKLQVRLTFSQILGLTDSLVEKQRRIVSLCICIHYS
jgi:exonuclease VII small subunit